PAALSGRRRARHRARPVCRQARVLPALPLQPRRLASDRQGGADLRPQPAERPAHAAPAAVREELHGARRPRPRAYRALLLRHHRRGRSILVLRLQQPASLSRAARGDRGIVTRARARARAVFGVALLLLALLLATPARA